jgi:hypothetical protein
VLSLIGHHSKSGGNLMESLLLLVVLLAHLVHFAGLAALYSNDYALSVFFLISCIPLYVLSLHWFSPSNIVNTLTLLLIILLISVKSLDFSSWLSRSGWLLFGVSLFGALKWGPPSYDNIGITELTDLCLSPIGFLLCICYPAFHLISWFCSRRFSLFWSVFAGFSLASVINLSKLISNLVSLTLRLEDQFQFRLTKVIFIGFIVACALYFYAIASFVKFPISALGLSLFYFSTSAVTISSATILWGDPIMLSPIGVGGFLASSILQIIGLTLVCFGSLANKIYCDLPPLLGA